MSLHDRLRAAILARQERAQAALNGPYESLSMSWPRSNGKTALSAFITAESPAFVLRQCARDLAILDRHQRDDCNDPNCPEIVELADAYAISTEEDTDHDG